MVPTINSAVRDIFGPGSQLEIRHVQTYEEMAKKVEYLKGLGFKIVLTMGTFDLLHIGHARYLERAKQRGDILIVGIDSDEKVRTRKGTYRPIVPQDERLEVLAHVRHVDLLFVKNLNDPHWQLLKTIRPDVLIATSTTYKPDQLEALKEFCGEVVILEPQSTTRTTARIREMLVKHGTEVLEKLDETSKKVVDQLDEVKQFAKQLLGGD